MTGSLSSSQSMLDEAMEWLSSPLRVSGRPLCRHVPGAGSASNGNATGAQWADGCSPGEPVFRTDMVFHPGIDIVGALYARQSALRHRLDGGPTEAAAVLAWLAALADNAGVAGDGWHEDAVVVCWSDGDGEAGDGDDTESLAESEPYSDDGFSRALLKPRHGTALAGSDDDLGVAAEPNDDWEGFPDSEGEDGHTQAVKDQAAEVVACRVSVVPKPASVSLSGLAALSDAWKTAGPECKADQGECPEFLGPKDHVSGFAGSNAQMRACKTKQTRRAANRTCKPNAGPPMGGIGCSETSSSPSAAQALVHDASRAVSPLLQGETDLLAAGKPPKRYEPGPLKTPSATSPEPARLLGPSRSRMVDLSAVFIGVVCVVVVLVGLVVDGYAEANSSARELRNAIRRHSQELKDAQAWERESNRSCAHQGIQLTRLQAELIHMKRHARNANTALDACWATQTPSISPRTFYAPIDDLANSTNSSLTTACGTFPESATELTKTVQASSHLIQILGERLISTHPRDGQQRRLLRWQIQAARACHSRLEDAAINATLALSERYKELAATRRKDGGLPWFWVVSFIVAPLLTGCIAWLCARAQAVRAA